MSDVTPDQIRAARAMLDWSMVDLAKAARVSVSSVMSAEGRNPDRVFRGSTAVVQRTLEMAGVRFIGDDGGGAGVRLRPRRPPSGQHDDTGA